MTSSESGRNRSQGWKHAKISGHENERDFGAILEQSAMLQKQLFEIKYPQLELPNIRPSVNVDGALQVESILGDLITSKIDAEIAWTAAQRLTISIKKSNAGQVWLVPVSRFIRAVQFHGKPLSPDASKALKLFIGGSNLSGLDVEFKHGISTEKVTDSALYEQELHQNRLLAVTIKREFPMYWDALIDYFKQNIGLITELMFARGLALRDEDTADLIVYNKVRNQGNMFETKSIAAQATKPSALQLIQAGPRNGGSTIYLPTGFLQMHHPQGENLMQFHHKYDMVWDLMELN